MARHARPTVPGTIAAMLVAIGVGGGDVQGQQLQLSVSQRGGQAGAEVTVSVAGLPPSTPIYIGFGGLGTSHELVGSTVTDPQGVLTLAVRVPTWAERNRSHFFFLAYSDQRPRGFSDPFIVTGPEDAVRVSGSLDRVVTGCALLRGYDDTVYTLLGETPDLAEGTRVVADGRLAPPDATPTDGDSPCSAPANIPVLVRQVQPG